MDIESVRSYCLSFPHVTEDIQWEHDLLFRIGGKIFTTVVLDPSHPYRLSFKCTPERFAELIEKEGIDPAPYVARYHWVALQSYDSLSKAEIEQFIRDSYHMVFEKLPKKIKAQLSS